jgi:protein SCO1/2
MTASDGSGSRLPFGLVALALVLTGILVWAVVFWNPGAEPGHSGPGVTTATPAGGDFTLHSATGPVTLQDFRGKVVLLYFGYTQCPDVCPTSLAQCTQALSGLDKTEIDQVRMIFVSVDPERDTAARLKEYAEYFHPNMVGVTGSPDEVARAATLYGSSYARQPLRADGSYAVDHSSFVYLIDRNGRLAASIPYGTAADRLRDHIRALL